MARSWSTALLAVALLLVDDAEAAIDDLFRQAEGPRGSAGEGGFSSGEEDDVRLDDGTVVPTRTWRISAGGDSCTAVASPDGSTVLVTVGRG